MDNTASVDIFDGIADVSPSTGAADDATENVDETTGDGSDSSQDETPVVTVAVVPDGAVSVTEFAAHMTQVFMKEKILAGEDLSQDDYVVAQSVYQTVKAQRDRIPHILVKSDGDAEARVYILKDEATAWWIARRDRLSTRGSGAQRASSRTAEDNLTLLGGAVYKDLYTQSRLKLWTERASQTDKLIEKYKGFLTEQKVDDDTVSLTVQEATDRFNSDMAAKAAEKAAKAKKSGKTDNSDDDDNE